MTIIVITGYERSGSTLLERLLVERSGGLGVGEVHHLSDRGISQGHLCSCGHPLERCAVWGACLRNAFGNWETAVAEISQLEQGGARELRQALRPGRRTAVRHRQAVDTLRRVYEGLGQASPNGCLIDSSKNPAWALLAREAAPDDVFVVHLRRDVRGCINSKLKVVARDRRTHSVDDFMLRSGTSRTSFDWLLFNLAAENVGFDYFVRYEQLATDHEAVVRSLLDAAGVVEAEEPGALHSFSGNPIRLDSRVEVSLDDEWRTSLSRSQSTLGAAATGLLNCGSMVVKRNHRRL